MVKYLLTTFFLLCYFFTQAQEILLLDRFNGNRIVNDSTVTVFSSDPDIVDLTQYLTIENTTDDTLALYLRKSVNYIADSTIDYYCFGVQCWPGVELTWIPDSIMPGARDSTFASHVVHFRRFESPPLPYGISSISYTIFDSTTYTYTVEATIHVIYNHSVTGVKTEVLPSVSVWPNPASEYLNIALGESVSRSISVTILSSKGALVKQLSANPAGSLLMIQVNDLSSGQYYGYISIPDSKNLFFRFFVK